MADSRDEVHQASHVDSRQHQQHGQQQQQQQLEETSSGSDEPLLLTSSAHQAVSLHDDSNESRSRHSSVDPEAAQHGHTGVGPGGSQEHGQIALHEQQGAQQVQPDVDDADQHLHQHLASGERQQQPQRQQHTFDPSTAARHQYLGDLEDLPGVNLLEEGACYRLPALPLPDVVLIPGNTVPLKLSLPEELRLLQASLSHPVQTRRIIILVHQRGFPGRQLDDQVGCAAELRQLKRQVDGSAYVILKGRQRVLRLRDGKPATQPWDAREENFQMHVRVLPEGDVLPVPQQLRLGCAHLAPWTTRPFNPQWLCEEALKRCETTLPAAASFVGGPLELSYWLAANLPLGTRSRLQLLQCRSSIDRLRMELELMSEMGAVRCRGCHSRLANTGDALRMTDEGIAGVFVNAHGYVHDMATFSRVQGLTYQGKAETEHSWFPGYAWTICNCRTCYSHLGWRFDSVQPGLSPQRFWGLRRTMLLTGQAGGNMAAVDDVDMDENAEDEGEMDGEDEGGSEDDDGEDDDEGGGLGAQLLNTAIPHNLRLRILRFIGSRS